MSRAADLPLVGGIGQVAAWVAVVAWAVVFVAMLRTFVRGARPRA